MKNFVILGLATILLFGSGCASVYKGVRPNGNQYCGVGSPQLGGGVKTETRLNVINSTRDTALQVFWDGEELTSEPLGPGKIFTFSHMMAFRGEEVSLSVQVWDVSHNRMVGDIRSATLVMGNYWGIRANTWTFTGSESGGVQSKTYGRSFYGGGFRGGYGGGYYNRFGY